MSSTSDGADASATNRAWAETFEQYAASIERGEFPQRAMARAMIAKVLRQKAAELRKLKPKPGRGNPAFVRKYDPVELSIQIYARRQMLRKKESVDESIDHVLVDYELDVDKSGVAKHYRKHRAGIARFFAGAQFRGE